MSGGASSSPVFAVRTMLILVALAIVGFLSFMLLFAYADDLRPKQNGGTHALSTSAVGFAGLADLVKATRGEAKLVRREADLDADVLLVLTPGPATDPAAIKGILDRREGLQTLIILPKWIAAPLKNKPNWVRVQGTLPESASTFPISTALDVTVGSPANGFRTITGATLETIYTGADGASLAAMSKDALVTVVADPDLFDNQGLATLQGAERAMEILDEANPGETAIAFDLTLHGFGRNPNLLKLAFEAPFLPLTLCILVAALLAGWHAMLRFGPVALPQRGIAFGKRALADNGAALLRLARRRHRTGERYAALVSDAAAAGTGAPPGLSGDALDRYLDRLDPDSEPFSSMAARAAAAPDTRSLLDAARALHHWKRIVTREHR